MVNLKKITDRYKQRVTNCLDTLNHPNVIKLAYRLVECIKHDQRLFVCGNGGSGYNASHIQNDFLYGISKMIGKGLKCQSLSANPAVITCLANDEGYDDIFKYQLAVEANKNDVLIVSADKDLAQLICSGVEQLLPPPTANPRLGWRLLNEEGVKERFGVPPRAILDYLAIIGDQADNIPGLNGVGPKTASKWLKEFGNLENLIQNAGRITPKRFCSLVYEKRDDLMRNIELVRLESDIELDLSDSNQPNLEAMEEIFTELEMRKSWEEAQKRYDVV